MAVTVGQLNLLLRLDDRDVQKGTSRVQQALLGLGKRAVQFGAVMGAGLLAAGGASLKMAADLEQSEIAFTTLLGSAEDADRFLRDLADFAARTPFEIAGLEQSARQLLAFGFEAEQVLPMMTAIGDAVSALGGGAFEIDRVTRALGQMQAKGKVSAEEMLQLAELGIPAWQMLADHIGVSIPEAMELATKGAIDAATGIEAILAGMNARFAGSMQQQSESINGMMSTLQDTIGLRMREIGTRIIETFDLKGKLQAGLDWLEAHSEEIADGVIAAFESIGDTLGDVRALIEDVAGWFSDLLDLISEGDWEGAGRMVGEALASGFQQLKDFGVRISQGIVDSIRAIDWAEVARAAVPALVGFVAGFVNALFDPVVWWDIVTRYWDEILLVLLGIITMPAKWAAGLAQFLGRIPLVGRVLEWLLTSIRSVGEQALQPFIDMAESLFRGFINGIGTGGKGLLPMLRGVISGAIDGIVDFGETLYLRGLYFMERLGGAIASAGPKQVVGAFRTLLSKIDEVLSGAVTRFGEIGRRIIEGFWKGLSSMFDWIRTRVSEFVGSMVSKVKGVLGISSPSRVFEGIGENIAAGLAVGLESARGIVERAAAGALVAPVVRFPATAPAAAAAVGPAGAALGPITINIYGSVGVDDIADRLWDELRRRTPYR